MRARHNQVPLSATDPKRYWNVWSWRRTRGTYPPDFLQHVLDIGGDGQRTLCGIGYRDTGWLDLTEFHPSCKKCRAKLLKLGFVFEPGKPLTPRSPAARPTPEPR
jgi:hypothetical protein